MIKRKKRKLIRNMAIIAIIIFVIFVAWIIIKKDKQKPTETGQTDNFSTTLPDGSTVNNSPKIKENKKFDGLDITNIEIKQNGQVTQLIATVTNNTKDSKGGYPAKITFVDSKNNELSQMGIYIKDLKPGESTTLNASITFDYTNAYDIIIKK